MSERVYTYSHASGTTAAKKEEAGETSILDKSFMLGGKRRKCWMCFTVNWIQLAGVLFGWVITVVIAAITSGLAFYVLYNSPSKN